MYPTTSFGGFHFVNPVMSPATMQPSNVSSSESKNDKKADTLSVIQKKENESEEKLRLLKLYKDERFVKTFQSKVTKQQYWIGIADVLNKAGFKTVTGEQCDAKFRNLKRTYTKVEDNNNSKGRSPSSASSMTNFKLYLLDQIKSNQNLSAALCMVLANENQTMRLLGI